MSAGRVLESWKEIAQHLNRNVRTCQLWERTQGLPVHRLDGSPKARVYAYAAELDRWLEEKFHEKARTGNGRHVLPTLPRWNIGLIAGLAAVAAAAIGASAWLMARQAKVHWANDHAIPEIERLLLTPDKERAYDLAMRAAGIIPSSPHLAQVMPLVSGALSVDTDPAGAEAYVRPYGPKDAPWRPLGRTPVTVRLSLGTKHWRVERDGYAAAEGTVPISPGQADKISVTLDEADRAPAGMVRIPGEVCSLPQFQIRSSPSVWIEDFWIDRTEVTNRQYRLFVEAGGYTDPRYWRHPFELNGRTLSREEAMGMFVDSTGKPGPAAWASGTFPAGQDDLPVTGVSWYEAAAYAAFAGKRLPSAYHWNLAAGILRETDYLIALSNFDGQALAPVATCRSLGCFGTYDMAGNAKEWCSNEAGGGRVNCGGAWNEAQYWFFLFDHYPASMRAANFGFRCMKDIGEAEAAERAHAPLEVRPEPDYARMTPCSDVVFEVYRTLYGYTKTDLGPRVESRQDWSPDTVVEKVSFRDAGSDERIIAYLFLPKNTPPPYQSVVYFPGSSAMSLGSVFDYMTVKSREVELYTRRGRAFVFPVFWNTFERQIEPLPARSRQFLRDRMVRHHRELSRTLDYLEARPDFDTGRIAYQGLSWGAYAGPIHLALEKRFKAANLVGGGFYWEMYAPDRGSPEWDAVNFAPRVRVPLLMQQGQYDAFYPLETNARVLFRLFGTPEADKHLVVYPTGHSVWLLNESRRDIFDFLDRYLGRPNI
jgi:formylglycine-generating enzyme required for sulfatase activity/dienelactone hydrolase